MINYDRGLGPRSSRAGLVRLRARAAGGRTGQSGWSTTLRCGSTKSDKLRTHPAHRQPHDTPHPQHHARLRRHCTGAPRTARTPRRHAPERYIWEDPLFASQTRVSPLRSEGDSFGAVRVAPSPPSTRHNGRQGALREAGTSLCIRPSLESMDPEPETLDRKPPPTKPSRPSTLTPSSLQASQPCTLP